MDIASTDNGPREWRITKKELSINESNIIKLRSKNPEAKETIDVPFYPDDATLSIFSALVYDKRLKEGVNIALKGLKEKLDDADKKAIDKLNLPNSWEMIRHTKYDDDNYLGAAFWNKDRNQLVISHRGTVNKINKKKLSESIKSAMKSLLTDYEGIIQNKDTSQIHSACTFCAQVLKNFNLDKISISFTGHSLGAWLAQITGFCFKYLKLIGDKFERNESGNRNNQIHVVGFDSPGCSEMMCKISEEYFGKYNSETVATKNIAALDITIYFNIPNIINCINSHRDIKNLLQIVNRDRIILYDTNSCYNFDTHKIKNFVSMLLGNDDTKIFAISNWPAGSAKGQSLRSSQNVQGPLHKFGRNLMGGVASICEHRFSKNALNDDYMKFFQEYRKSIKKGRMRLGKTIRNLDYLYSVEDFQYDKIAKSAFSEKELDFLRNYEMLKKMNKDASSFQDFLNANNLGDFKKFLVEFTIEENVMLTHPFKEPRESLIKRVKNLAVFFPDACQNLDEDSREIKKHPNLALYSILSDSYVEENLGKWKDCVEFEDTIGLSDFLKNNQEIIFCLITKGDTKKEMLRIRGILSKNQNVQPCFLDSIRLASMKKNRILVEDIFADSNCDFDSLLVIDCGEENGPDSEIPVEKLINVAYSNGNVKKKLILVTPCATWIEKSKIAIKKTVNELTFSDFAKNTQKKFLQEEIFILKNECMSLKEFLNLSNVLSFSNEEIQLLSHEHLLEILLARKKQYIELCSGNLFKNEHADIFISNKNMSVKKNELVNLLKRRIRPRYYSGRHVKFLVTGNYGELSGNWLRSEILKIFENSEIEYDNLNSETFCEFCLKNIDKRIYWLHVNDNRNGIQVELKKIFDSTFYVEREFYRKISSEITEMSLTESDLVATSDKIILMEAETGNEEKIVLRKLAYGMKKKWLFYINLRDIDSTEILNMDEEIIINLLVKYNRFETYTAGSSGIMKTLLRFTLRNQGTPIVIFFDEFNPPNYEARKRMIKMFAYIKSHPRIRMYIAATAYLTEILEDQLIVPPLKIRLIDKDKKIKFLDVVLDTRVRHILITMVAVVAHHYLCPWRCILLSYSVWPWSLKVLGNYTTNTFYYSYAWQRILISSANYWLGLILPMGTLILNLLQLFELKIDLSIKFLK